MRIFLIIYNMAGLVVHVFGPVDQTFAQCQEVAARLTVEAVGRVDTEQLTFSCERRTARPKIQEFIRPRTTS